MTIDASFLRPGDCLVFSRRGLFDSIISLKTWSRATHVEVFLGASWRIPGAGLIRHSKTHTVASRNGQGVAVYPLDLADLYCVLRPRLPFDLDAAMRDFWANHNGRPYGWIALLSFCLIDLHDKGEFCSEFATNFYRAGGLDPFNYAIASDIVAPADMLYIHETVMEKVWSKEIATGHVEPTWPKK